MQEEVILYQTSNGETQLDVKLEKETIWLTQVQMAELFDCSSDNVSLHLKNIYNEGELQKDLTTEEISTVRLEGKRKVKRTVLHYNLDAILSLGYRVNSKNATQFRIWANNVLKEFLIKGYVTNKNVQATPFENIKNIVQLALNVIEKHELSADEATGLLRVITDYTYALDTLDKYDYQKLEIGQTTTKEPFKATYENAMQAIFTLKEKFGSNGLFANEKDQSFKSSIATIYQTFDGKELYPSVEEKAAMLLYLVTKNHSFSDGNKRIAALLFLWFLENNHILYRKDGTRLINNNALVALTLMIAESPSEEKDIMVKVVINLINKNN